jgi:regulator of protease activity HflC (stomatin/prohibitin superfamily)
LHGVKGPGLFVIIPVVDNVVAVIDERIQTTAFNAEQALTRDTVPVDVDAIIFWHVHDAQKAALAITDYRQAIDRVAQTSLREYRREGGPPGWCTCRRCRVPDLQASAAHQ